MICGFRKYPFPGGKWFIWAMTKNRVLAAVVTNGNEWMELLNKYRRIHPIINARSIE